MTPRSTTPWCAWSSPGRCATRWSTARATSARPATTRRPRCGTPSAGWRRSRWRWSATSTRRPSTSRPTTTARPRSRWSCPAGSRTCWSTARPASRSAWPRSIPPHNLREVAAGVQWYLQNPDVPTRGRCWTKLISLVQGPDFPTGALIMGRQGIEDAYRTGPRLDHHARGRRGRGDPEPPVPGRHRAALPGQPRQPGARRSPSWSRTAGSPASPTSRTTPRAAPASAW